MPPVSLLTGQKNADGGEATYNPAMHVPCILFAASLSVLSACNYRGYDAALAGPAYPFALHTTNTADVQVFRDGTHITVVNATANAWPTSRIWVNQRFSRSIKGLAAGETTSLALFSFWDEDGESFPAGGFLSSRPSMPVRLVELESDPDTPMVGFITIAATGEQ